MQFETSNCSIMPTVPGVTKTQEAIWGYTHLNTDLVQIALMSFTVPMLYAQLGSLLS